MKQTFELDQYARDALTLFIGYVLDYFETDKNNDLFYELRNSLTKAERAQLILTYEFLSDSFVYREVKSQQLEDDMLVLKKILKFCSDHDMFDDDWDLMAVTETILNY